MNSPLFYEVLIKIRISFSMSSTYSKKTEVKSADENHDWDPSKMAHGNRCRDYFTPAIPSIR